MLKDQMFYILGQQEGQEPFYLSCPFPRKPDHAWGVYRAGRHRIIRDPVGGTSVIVRGEEPEIRGHTLPSAESRGGSLLRLDSTFGKGL